MPVMSDELMLCAGVVVRVVDMAFRRREGIRSSGQVVG